MLADRLHIDFETRDASDLRKEGAHRYARTAEILCMGWAINDEPVVVTAMLRRNKLPSRVIEHVANRGIVVAHNAPFESVIWERARELYGWPKLFPSQLECTMAMALAMGFPPSLEGAAAAAGIDQQKDMAGNRLMLKLAKPRKILDDMVEWWEPEKHPADFKKLYRYCAQDVVVERLLHKRLIPLSSNEKKIWQLDFEINARGVMVDEAAVKTASLIADLEKRRLNARIQKLTVNWVATCNAHAQLKKWLTQNGIETKGVAKNDVTGLLLDDNLPRTVRLVLQTRQEAAKSSLAKLKSLSARTSVDSRIRGLFQYHAAHTGRWGGRGLQPQNFPRPKLSQREIDGVFELMAKFGVKSRDAIEMIYGSPNSVLSDCLRGFLIAPLGKKLIAADFSSIEACVLAWLAGEERVLEIFRTHGKSYEHAAAVIYGIPMADVYKDQRQVGKTAVLALGYQGGVGAFGTMARTFGLKMAPLAESLWERANRRNKEMARSGWDSRGRKSGIGKREWMACELVKLAWRDAHPNIVDFWGEMESLAIQAVKRPGISQCDKSRRLSWVKKGSFLFCLLPSGRKLCYPYPEIVEVETPWGEERSQLRYKTEDSQIHKWVRVHTYGGSLVENIVQAVSRDILAEAMLRVSDEGWRLVLHVHDELVAETVHGTLEEFEYICETLPHWAEGLPLKAKGWVGSRYRK